MPNNFCCELNTTVNGWLLMQNNFLGRWQLEFMILVIYPSIQDGHWGISSSWQPTNGIYFILSHKDYILAYIKWEIFLPMAFHSYHTPGICFCTLSDSHFVHYSFCHFCQSRIPVNPNPLMDACTWNSCFTPCQYPPAVSNLVSNTLWMYIIISVK